MFSRFFIDRPIFAGVISIVIMVAGAVSYFQLPVEQTPNITPPTVSVTTTYPGANAQVIADTVAQPIEAEVNGVDGMMYMASKCGNDGSYELTVTFEVGTDIDMATVLVQNRVAIAMPGLPEEVTREGVKTEKQSTNIVLMVNLVSENDRFDELYQSNFIGIHVKDRLGRIPGVGKVNVMGAKDFGMRIWLNPNKLAARGVTTSDVVAAIREQNVQVAAGQIGAPPAPKGQEFEYTVTTQGRLTDVEQFKQMIIKVGDDGGTLRVGDVARVELGAQSYRWSVRLDERPSIAVAIYQLPGANSLEVAEGIRAEMDKIRFPPGLGYTIAYDTTMFVTSSIDEVKITLLIAVVLVVLTVYIFLQDFRTTLIPAMTIPVSLIGTFAVMQGLGFSLNTISLFGIVLAIGIVVDDAIVVVENTMRLIDDEQLSAEEATKQAMVEVTGPVVATTAVLLAVFIPTAMMAGITGRLYREFSVTIATATVFSSINALTLSPALCGILLRPSTEKRFFLFAWFNKLFESSTRGYLAIVQTFVRRGLITMVVYAAMIGAMVWAFQTIPGGFLPNEDQGYILVSTTLPDGATLKRTQGVVQKIERIMQQTEGVAHVISVSGYSALDSVVQPNSGTCFVVFDKWDDRPGLKLSYRGILQTITPKLAAIQEANAIAFPPPPITGLGNAGGFDMRLLADSSVTYNQLEKTADDLVAVGNTESDVITRLNNNFRANVPQLYLDVNTTKAMKMHVRPQEIYGTLQAFLGSAYVNDFNKFGRVFKVMIQADSQFRAKVSDIDKLFVRSTTGEMVPIKTLVKVRDTVGPQNVFRYQQDTAATITGSPVPGYSSGQAIEAMQQIAQENLPPSISYAWSGITYEQLKVAGQATVIFLLAIGIVYLFLAAQYESWTIPLAVMFAVPLAILGGLLATLARRYDNNVYTQIGIVLLIGLASKTAILIVEFAKQKREEGHSIIDAAVEASRLRFRAILMTAFSFILGVIPLAVATGAGSASRRMLGTAVLGGMTAATVLGVFFVPLLYVVVQSISERIRGVRADAGDRDQGSGDRGQGTGANS